MLICACHLILSKMKFRFIMLLHGVRFNLYLLISLDMDTIRWPTLKSD